MRKVPILSRRQMLHSTSLGFGMLALSGLSAEEQVESSGHL